MNLLWITASVAETYFSRASRPVRRTWMERIADRVQTGAQAGEVSISR
jgi:hypothetical protein